LLVNILGKLGNEEHYNVGGEGKAELPAAREQRGWT